MNIQFFVDEYESLAELILSCFKINTTKEELISLLQKHPFRSIIAVRNKEVIGHVMIDSKYDMIKNKHSFFLSYICVKEEERKKGIGSFLLGSVEQLAKKEHISTIEFTSGNQRKEAHHLYLKHGYSIKNTSHFIKNI